MIKTVVFQNLKTGEELTIGEGSNNYSIEELNIGDIEVQANVNKVPFQVGKIFKGYSIGERPISLIGCIYTDVEMVLGTTWKRYKEEKEKQMKKLKNKLNSFFSIYEDVKLKFGEYTIEGRPTAPIKYSVEDIKNNETICYFNLDIFCSYPMFRKKQKVFSLSEVIPAFSFPIKMNKTKKQGIVFGRKKRKQTVLIENNGDIDVGCIITIKARGGTIPVPVISEASTNERISLDVINLDDGDVLTINTNTGKESIIVHNAEIGEDIQQIGLLSIDSTFLKIRRGKNYYIYEIEEKYKNNVDITFSFYEEFFNMEDM